MDKPETSMLIKLCAYFPSDIGFATRARLLQSLWREMYGWLMDKEDAENRLQSQGLYPRRLYRNKLYPEFTRKRGVNFLTPRIRDLSPRKLSKSGKTAELTPIPRSGTTFCHPSLYASTCSERYHSTTAWEPVSWSTS